jgi:hypothetical protein
VGLIFLEDWTREIIIWVSVLALLVLSLRKTPPIALKFLSIFMLTGLAIAEMIAFNERLLPYRNTADVIPPISNIRNGIEKSGIQFSNSLNRSVFDLDINLVGVNQGALVGISTLEGYASPLRRFNELFFYTHNHEPVAAAMYFRDFGIGSPTFEIFGKLYNIQNIFALQQNKIYPNPNAFGPVWISKNYILVDNFFTLSQKFKESLTKETAYLFRGDFDKFKPELSNLNCSSSQIDATETQLAGQIIKIKLKTEGLCLLTVSTNFSRPINITGLHKSGDQIKINAFPIYGALTGMVIPEKVMEIKLDFSAQPKAIYTLLVLLGWLGFIVSVLIYLKSNSSLVAACNNKE